MIWIRVATKNDLDTLVDLNLINKDKIYIENNYIMACEVDDELVATASLKTSGNYGLIHSLNILDEFKNQLLEDATVRAVINLASNKGIEKLFFTFTQNNLIKVFERIGFIPNNNSPIDPSLDELIKPGSTTLFIDIKSFFTNHSC